MNFFFFFLLNPLVYLHTVVPVMNGHPRDQAKVSVHCRWPLIRGNLTLKCVGRGIDNVAVQGRWPLTRGSPKAGTTVESKFLTLYDYK